MSKTVDSKVVEMRFDNSKFEKNVATSMSTIDKLKEKLKFNGSTKGLDEVSKSFSGLNSAAKSVNINSLGQSVDAVRAKFSALQVAGITAISNITNTAVNAGKRMVSALTIEPVGDGFKEYEMTLNAVQTTMSGTGETAKEVEKQLKMLDEYADETVFSSADMFQNLPKFTNAGVDLEKSKTAMIGIANAVALAGGGARQASSAFYNLGQAIGLGYLSRMDYNSIAQTAGMTTMEWKNQMVEAAIAQGTLTKTGEDAYKIGKKTFTLQSLFIDGLQEQWATTDVMMKVFSDYGSKETEIGKKAWAAATKVKTFSDMMESLKASAGTGWKDTWQLLFGDLDEATNFWTDIYNFVGNIIDKMSKARNTFLKSVLGKSFEKIANTLKKVTDPAKKATDSIKKVSNTVKDFGNIADKVIRGNFGNGEARYNALTKAGINYYEVQNKVNEKLKYSFRYSQKQIDAQNKLLGVQNETTKSTEDNAKAQGKRIQQLTKLSDAELKSLGLNKKQIKALRELKSASEKTGISVAKLFNNADEIDGRWLIINSFKNAISGITSVLTSVKDAWKETFDPITPDQIFNVIAAIHKFSKSLLVNEETADKLKRTFKGLFAIIDIILTVVGGPIKIAFKALTQLLGVFDLDILDVTAKIGDVIVKFRDWIDKTIDFTGIFEVLSPYIKEAGKAIQEWFNNLKDSEAIKKLTNYLSNSSERLKEWLSGLKDSGALKHFLNRIKSSYASFKKWIEGFKDAESIPKYIISGLVNGLKSGVSAIFDAAVAFAKSIIDTVKSVLGINSPSTVFIAIGAFIVAGLIIGLTQGFPQVFDKLKEFGGDTMSKFTDGLQNGASTVWTFLKNFGSKIVEFIKNIDFGAVLAMTFAGGLTYAVIKISKALESFGGLALSIKGMFDKIGNSVQDYFKNIGKAQLIEAKSKAILNFAIAIGILAASIYVLAKIEPGLLWNAVGAVAALAVIIGGLAFAVSRISSADPKGIATFALVIFALGSALIKMSIAMKLLSTMSWDEIAIATAGLLALELFIITLIYVGKTAGKDVAKIGGMLIGLAVTLALLVVVIKLISMLSPSELAKGIVVMVLFGAFVLGMIAATKLAGNEIDKVGSMILKISAAMLLLVVTIKLISSLDGSAIVKGLTVITAFGAIIVALMYATKLASGNTSKIGSTILGIAAAMAIMAITMRLVAGMDAGSIAKGLIVIAGFASIITGLILATNLAGDNLKGIAATIMAIAVAIAILAAVAIVLGLVKIENLAKGLIAIGLLSVMVTAMIKATRGANDVMKNLIVISVAIALMAGAIAGLSFIDKDKLATATVALGSVMGMFALLIKSASSLDGAKKMIGPMLLMVGVVAALAGIIYALSILNPESALGATASLSLLLLAVSGALVILSHISGTFNMKDMLLGILSLTLMAVPLLAFVGVLAAMQGIQNATTNALLLTTMATVLTVLLIPLSVIGALVGASGGIILLGIAALALMAVPLLAFVGVLAAMQGIQNATINAFALISLTNAMADVLVKISLVAPLAVIGVAALAALTGLMLGIGTLAVAIGALMEKFPALENFIDKGLPILSKLAYGVGDIVGSLIAGFSAGLLSGLPEIGLTLSKFMTNLTPFIIGASLVDESVLKGVGILSAAIIALTVADFINGIMSFMSFGSSFADLGTELSKFMINATPFIVGAKMFDPSMVEGVKALASTILIITAADVLNGLTSFLHIGSGNPLGNFGTQVGELGSSLTTFATSLEGIDESALSKVNIASKAIKALAEAADKIPNSGGWAGKIFGEGSLASFSEELVGTGTALKDFITNIGTFGETEYTTIKYAAKAINKFAKAADEIPNSGGWVSKLFGEESLGSFSMQIALTGGALKAFILAIGTFGEDQLTTVDFAAKAITKLGEAAEATQSGFWDKLFGKNSLAEFSAKLPDLGSDIAEFASNAGNVDEKLVANAVKSLNSVTELTKTDIGTTTGNLESFGKAIVTFSTNVSTFSTNMGSVDGDSISNAIKKMKELITFADGIGKKGSKSLSSFGSSLKNVATDGINKFVGEFSSNSAITKVKDAASGLMDKLISGIDSKKETLSKAGKDAASNIINAIKTNSQYNSMKSAGQYLGAGLVEGINAKQTDVYNAGFALGQAAVKGEKDGQASKSPSKLTIKAGKWLGEGLVIGMQRMNKAVYKSGYGLGDTATSTISSAISRISDYVNSDIDAQPTIRPVLDLSDVTNGANSINGLFNANPSVGVLSNINAISSSMNKRQNGNYEVISAIKDLKNSVKKSSGDTYQINGITYDDGSNVSDAIKTLIRATRVERRV